MKNSNNSLVNKNNQWFSRDEAFSYLETDLESQVRIHQVLSIFKSIYKNLFSNKLLDIGCADGQLSKELIEIGYEVHGIDISNKLLVQAKKRKVKIKKADATQKLPYQDNYFNYVFAGEIIEHFVDTELIMQEINRVLKTNGLVVITTPNLVHFPERWTFLKGNAPDQVQPLHSYLKFHIRQFTHNSWRDILDKFSFEVVDSRSSIVVFKRDEKDLNKVVSYSKLLADIFPSFGASVIMTAKKKGKYLLNKL